MATLRASGVRRLAAILLDAREPSFLLGPQGRLVFVNAAWEALTGRPADEVLGQDPRDLVGSEDDGEGLAGLSVTSEALAGRPSAAVALIPAKSGGPSWKRVEFLPLHDASGSLAGIFGLIREQDASPLSTESESRAAATALARARERLRGKFGPASPVGRGPRHDRLLSQAVAASRVEAPVLIIGEASTGKRQVARLIHERGSTSQAPFVVVDCEALAADALGEVLFANTSDGDIAPIAGDPGSTLMIAEITRMPRDLQARLILALPHSQVRLVATTTVDPEEAVRTGDLREDLYLGLSVMVLRTDPLRDRIDELPLLAQNSLEIANRRGVMRHSSFASEAMEALTLYDWPGNLGELTRVINAAHEKARADVIAIVDLPAEIRGELGGAYLPPPAQAPITPLDEWLTLLERKMIEKALATARGNKSRAAELLDISRPRLYRRIKELNLPDEGNAPENSNGRGRETP